MTADLELAVDVAVAVAVEVEVETVEKSMASSLLCKPKGRNIGEPGYLIEGRWGMGKNKKEEKKEGQKEGKMKSGMKRERCLGL